jgi:hypothetical protein
MNLTLSYDECTNNFHNRDGGINRIISKLKFFILRLGEASLEYKDIRTGPRIIRNIYDTSFVIFYESGCYAIHFYLDVRLTNNDVVEIRN